MLSVSTKKIIRAGLANRVAGDELIAAIDTLANLSEMTQGAAVAAIGALATVSADIGALATVGPPAGNVPDVGVGAIDNQCALAADVNAGFDQVQQALDASIVLIDARVTTLQAAFDAQNGLIDARVTTLQAKVDALTASLRTANLIAT